MEYSFVEIGLFFAIVVIALLVDLYAHKQDEAISVKSAAIWSAFWILLALAFSGYVYTVHGSGDAQLFLAGYFLEKSLSVDNLFVIMAIFSSFWVADKYQHRVLYYGIIGALLLRFVFIFAGTVIIQLFGKPALFLFGAFILYTAYAMWKNMSSGDDEAEDYSDHWSVKFVKKFMPVYPKVESHDFFIRDPENKPVAIHPHITLPKARWMVTPLFLCLICIEVADIMFAFDSVPAVIAITEKPYLVYTSNIFAILGLRSLYFLLAAAKRYLCHLEKAVIVILIFIGIKLLVGAGFGYHIAPMLSLGVVLGLLCLGILGSVLFPEKETE